MADFIKKSGVRDYVELNVGGEFYESLDDEVRDLIDDAVRRAGDNDRKTVQARDL